MAESGCLKSEKLHTLTLKDDIVTKNFETEEHMSLTLGSESFRELNEGEASLINGIFKDINKDNDEGQKTNAIGGFTENDTYLLLPDQPYGQDLAIFDDVSGQSYINRLAHAFQIDRHAPRSTPIIGQPITPLHDGSDQGIKNAIELNPTPPHENSHSNVHKIIMPPMSILKNMYVIVQNNNISISQYMGADRNWRTQATDAAPEYKDINLRLTTVKKNNSNNYSKIFEETSSGGNVDNFIKGNNFSGVFKTSGAGDSTDINKFRHAGAILPKNTIIPVVTNYLFSTQEEKHISICTNGYIHPSAPLDRLQLNSENDNLVEGGYSNFTNEEKEIYVIIDSSIDGTSEEGLTGITHGRRTNDVFSIEDSEISHKLVSHRGLSSNYLSNKVRDATFINPEVRTSNGSQGNSNEEDNTTYLYKSLVENYNDIDYRGIQYKDNVVFKVICDFQTIDVNI